MKNTYIIFALFGSMLFTACNPNKDIYNQLDEQQKPYAELNVPYTIADAEYAWSGNKTVTSYKAFCDTLLPESFIPTILSRKFPALNVNSTVSVTYNYLGNNPSFADKTVFGYKMDTKDYDAIGGNVAKYNNFSKTDSAKWYLPTYLLTLRPNAKSNDTLNVFYVFYGSPDPLNGDTYKFDGTVWSFVRSFDVPQYIGYALTPEDYYAIGGTIAANSNFTIDYPASTYLPGFLRWKFPFAVAGDFKIIGYKYYDAVAKITYFNTAKFIFDGSLWQIQANTDQYINTQTGWIYDPAIRIIMANADYGIIVTADTLKDSHSTAGYMYGASTYKNDFDIRVSVWKNYAPSRFTGMSDDQVAAFIIEQVKKGIVILLQTKFPQAQPLIKGVEAYYFVTFVTYDGTGNETLTYKFQCMAAASGSTPPTFEFVEIAK